MAEKGLRRRGQGGDESRDRRRPLGEPSANFPDLAHTNPKQGWYGCACLCFKRAFILLLCLILAVLLRLLYFFGVSGDSFQQSLFTQTPLHPNADLQTVLKLSIPPGNIAVSPVDGQIFFNFHPEYTHPSGAKIGHCFPEGKKAFCSSWVDHVSSEHVNTVLSLRIDIRNRLYLLDFNNHVLAPGSQAALVMFRLGKFRHDKFGFKYNFPLHVAPRGSFLNDMQISPDGQYIYIVDTGFIGSILGISRPGLIIFHVPTQKSRRVLHGHPSMLPDNRISMSVKDSTGVYPQRLLGLFTMRIGVDSVAIDSRGEFLYFGPVTGRMLYRIPTNVLHGRQRILEDDHLEFEKHLEVYIDNKPMSDGIIMDENDNIFVTAFEHSSIVQINAKNRTLSLLFRDPAKLRWPDGFSYDWGKKHMYVTNSALHYKFSGKGKDWYRQKSPYYILRWSNSM